MSNVEKFQELLRTDEDLQEKVRAAVEAYAGDAADKVAAFDAVVAPLAAEAGLPFTFDEAVEYAEGDREVSLDDVDAVAGGEDVPNYGTGFCLVIGGSDDEGFDNCKTKNSTCGFSACEYVGLGFLYHN